MFVFFNRLKSHFCWPGAIQEDALAQLADLIGRSNVWRVAIEVGQGLAIDLKSGVRIVDQRLRQVVHGADCRTIRRGRQR